VPDSPIHLLSAARFSIAELTAAYNQTRVDYLVPMPMDVERLAAYVHMYDVSLADSLVAMAAGAGGEQGETLGLAMLGLRPGRAWITRLGVLAARRRHGTGEALVRGLLAAARQRGITRAVLEVIQGNQAAHGLFQKLGFVDTRELLVLQRPPAAPAGPPAGRASWLGPEDALEMLKAGCVASTGARGLPWTNEPESFRNAHDLRGLRVDLGSAGNGWLAFRRQRSLLSHFVFHTERGDPRMVGAALLGQLYHRYPERDTYIENVPVNDPHVAALDSAGFLEVFQRVEMVREG
jgi:ribosomal protein S18 acetylase RimI-like enzyme